MIGLHVRAESDTAFGPQLQYSMVIGVRERSPRPRARLVALSSDLQQLVGDLGVPVTTDHHKSRSSR